MSIDQEISLRIDYLRFPLIVGVVFIHAYGGVINTANGSYGITAHGFSYSVMSLISQVIARVAVPLFFLIAGYLFYANFTFSCVCYLRKIKSRINTLLIPYLFWNILTLFVFFMAQQNSFTSSYFSDRSQLISSFTFYDFFDAIFGVGRLPISYQFWFIRDLMLLVIASPLIYLFLKFIPRIMLIILFFLWVSNITPKLVPGIDAIFFFSLGAYFSNIKYNLFFTDKYGWWIFFLYIMLIIADKTMDGFAYKQVIHNLDIFVGIFSALFLTKFISNNALLKEKLIKISSCSFFVFAFHEPI